MPSTASAVGLEAIATEPEEPLQLAEAFEELEKLAKEAGLQSGEGSGDMWVELAQQFLPMYQLAAAGKLRISPQQRFLLDRIMDRGFGKPGSEASNDTPELGVVVLPTLYTEQQPLQVCPVCLQRLKPEESDG